MQVTTPSWPGAGNAQFPRASDGNTLGCVNDDNVLVSQDFFSLWLNKDDVVKVLKALLNASVVTDRDNPQLVRNGGPMEIVDLVEKLGGKATTRMPTRAILSSGVVLISKPSALHVPPWQFVSAELGGISLRAATWWEGNGKIPSTTGDTAITCWDNRLGTAGAVKIATSGQWDGITFGLTGGPSADRNHAKVGVSLSGSHPYAIFGDMNQEGSISASNGCSRSQNGRGGMFFVVENAKLHDSVAKLIEGDTAPSE